MAEDGALLPLPRTCSIDGPCLPGPAEQLVSSSATVRRIPPPRTRTASRYGGPGRVLDDRPARAAAPRWGRAVQRRTRGAWRFWSRLLHPYRRGQDPARTPSRIPHGGPAPAIRATVPRIGRTEARTDRAGAGSAGRRRSHCRRAGRADGATATAPAAPAAPAPGTEVWPPGCRSDGKSKTSRARRPAGRSESVRPGPGRRKGCGVGPGAWCDSAGGDSELRRAGAAGGLGRVTTP